jgi:hypothetical protein
MAKDKKAENWIVVLKIISAIIGTIATLTTAYFVFINNKEKNETERMYFQATQAAVTEIVSVTHTAAALSVSKSETSITPSPVEVNDAPTNTPSDPIAVTQPLKISSDFGFESTCLDSRLWKPITNVPSEQLSSKEFGCLDLFAWGIFYDNSSIEMYSNKTGKEGVYGVMVPVPTNSYVEITVEVENISNGYVQFGIISEGDSLKDADGAFAIIYPPDENGVLKRVDLYTMTKGKEQWEKSHTLPEISNSVLHFTLELDGTKLLIQRVGASSQYEYLSIPFSPRYLFIGYDNSSRDTVIQITYTDLYVKEQ